MSRAIILTILIFILLSGCLLGAAGQLSWPVAWAGGVGWRLAPPFARPAPRLGEPPSGLPRA